MSGTMVFETKDDAEHCGGSHHAENKSLLGSHASSDTGKAPGEAAQSQSTRICNRKKIYNKKGEEGSSGVWKWKVDLATLKVATQCTFF